MNTLYKTVATLSFAGLVSLPGIVFGDVTGADPRLTGAPGDSAAACTECHTGTKLNGGGGSLKIIMPGDATYTPGVKQRIKLQVSDPTQRRWGFELTARVASAPSSAQAGDLSSTDSNTQVKCANGRAKPCSNSAVLQFITHTLSGTRLGTPNSATFEFDWTPPSADVGDITLYAAGNAANGNTQETGDHIYTTNLSLTPAALVAVPTIGAVPETVAPNSWITISGKNLATTNRAWTLDELATGQFPVSLDNVSVTINGKPAYVEFISPERINILTPSDDAVGPVEVRVTSNGQASNTVTTNLQSVSPSLFTFDGKYAATTPGDNSMLDKSGAFFSASSLLAPLKPGDTITLYGTGFGPTDPGVPDAQSPDGAANLVTAVNITIGGVTATVTSAGLAPGLPHIYQLSVQVPDGLADGDQALSAEIGGATAASTIAVRN